MCSWQIPYLEFISLLWKAYRWKWTKNFEMYLTELWEAMWGICSWVMSRLIQRRELITHFHLGVSAHDQLVDSIRHRSMERQKYSGESVLWRTDAYHRVVRKGERQTETETDKDNEYPFKSRLHQLTSSNQSLSNILLSMVSS